MSLPQPSQPFFWTQESWGPALRCRPMLDVVPHLFTTRAIDVSRDPSSPGLRAVAASLGVDPQAIVQAHQVHGRTIVEVRAGERAPETEGDILVCVDPGRVVGVRAADCLPVLLCDDSGRVVAAVHAGWRGVAGRAAIFAVDRLQERFGVRPQRLMAAVGPSIGPCCYDVKEDTREAFRAQGHAPPLLESWFARSPSGGLRLNLWRAIRDQLEGAGLLPSHVFCADLCTMTHAELFHSYRRDGRSAGRNGAFVALG